MDIFSPRKGSHMGQDVIYAQEVMANYTEMVENNKVPDLMGRNTLTTEENNKCLVQWFDDTMKDNANTGIKVAYEYRQERMSVKFKYEMTAITVETIEREMAMSTLNIYSHRTVQSMSTNPASYIQL